MSYAPVYDLLQKKYPESQVPPISTLLSCDNLPPFEVVEVTRNVIQKVASLIQGSAGPGGCDSGHWQDVLLRYGAHSERLRDQVASMARRLTNSIILWNDIRGFVSSRPIALDKNPSVRPIGVRETLRHIVGKAVGHLTRLDIEKLCGVSQLCSDLKAGIEGGVHAIRELFDDHSDYGWEVLMVDASNAFNSLNRVAVLWNSRVTWPCCSQYLFNTYSSERFSINVTQ